MDPIWFVPTLLLGVLAALAWWIARRVAAAATALRADVAARVAVRDQLATLPIGPAAPGRQ